MYAAALGTGTTTFDDYNYATQHYENTANGDVMQVSLLMRYMVVTNNTTTINAVVV